MHVTSFWPPSLPRHAVAAASPGAAGQPAQQPAQAQQPPLHRCAALFDPERECKAAHPSVPKCIGEPFLGQLTLTSDAPGSAVGETGHWLYSAPVDLGVPEEVLNEMPKTACAPPTATRQLRPRSRCAPAANRRRHPSRRRALRRAPRNPPPGPAAGRLWAQLRLAAARPLVCPGPQRRRPPPLGLRGPHRPPRARHAPQRRPDRGPRGAPATRPPTPVGFPPHSHPPPRHHTPLR